ncbi:tRNA(His) guanylyltransferase 1-like isoform X2 [Cynara cardunculus var. scolymus]|uniref:tRNA(His) guanylyltransferase 1-like isoform X2 n=1 Tax=Cynara cardunculus var. scolymus TaxID=59895 RepID=UPI000D624109|nr:tRNA(His) guanylyltransferase 1-like isoform X2 [Cynara cardunculus var. scolymus]
MANSKYEYVKSFENEDEMMYPNLIVVRIDGRNFERFSEINEFEKPNDERALNLMNCCATSVLEKYPDIILAYGFSDEYSFVFKKETKFYQRRVSKMLSLIVSFFASLYVAKWREFFPTKGMISTPSFKSRVICCPSMEVLQAYLAWRQRECHSKNQYNTCLWMLVKNGKSEREAHEVLKVDDTLKISNNEAPVKRLRKKVIIVHSENIASRSFWNDYSCLCKEIGGFEQNVNNIKQEYVKSFQSENKLLPFTWIVIRIDGSHFHRFSEVQGFEKPNDEHALKLMNSCAVAVLEEFNDIVFAYGVSDEYSFVFKRNTPLYQRRASEIVSATVSFFSSTYVMKWKEFFPKKELKYPPNFDGRAVCYPSYEIIRDYLAWRQVDCHINNQYNTCFWMLVKSGKSTREAQSLLKGTQTQEKNQMLSQLFGIDYNMLPIIFRNGSSVFWDKETTMMDNGVVAKSHKKAVVEHPNIIEDEFWEAHSLILEETSPRSQDVLSI